MKEENDLLEELYRRYAHALYAYGFKCYADRNLVEDAMHDVFLDIYHHQDTFLHANSPKQYLRAALQHRLKRIVKRQREKVDVDSPELNALPDGDDDIEAYFIEQEDDAYRKQMARRLIGQLTQNQRTVVCLRLYEQKSFEEIARLMNINCQSAQNLYQRSMAKCRDSLRAERIRKESLLPV
ncbi:MAG: sigma-70 family RNA polymerase sigma factor [Mediterranea sp.]|jgi:RNA polymerase sigma-70 factor (ECF subfamily)|nr:sigma-70 family RNA polymerase sigma factor [Mediterranea sp.]